MKSPLVFLISVCVAVLLLVLSPPHRQSSGPGAEEQEEYYGLVKALRHLDPDSPEALRVAHRLEELKERERPGAENPGEFARDLYERTIPYGETVPAYKPGYRATELQKAIMLAPQSPNLLPWVERGPGNVTGRVRGLVVDPDDPTGNTWFIGSVGGGIWKTTNAGSDWIEVAPTLPNLAVSTIAMAASNHNIMYAGTGESMFSVDVINGDGMLKSTDHGQTWFPLASTLNNIDFNNIARIIIDPTNPSIVLAATTSGRYKLNVTNTSSIMKSINGGTSWAEVYREATIGTAGRVKKVLQIIETPGNFNIQYAAIDERGILKSTNAGEAWFFSSNGISDTTGRFELAIAPSNVNKIYVAAEGTPNSNLYVSSDAGANWTLTTVSGTNTNWLSAQGWYDNTIVVHPTDENKMYVGGVNLYTITMISPTQRTIASISAGSVHVDHHNLMIIPRTGGGFRILNSNDGGIGVSGDSSSGWTKPTDGLNTTQFYGVDKKPGASAYIGGMQDNGTWRSPENATAASRWVSQIGGDGYQTSWHFNDPSKLIGGSQYNGIRRSTNGGQTWTSATSGLTETASTNAPFITKIAKTFMDPDLLFAVGASGVFRSTNFGANWTLSAIPAGDWGAISSFHDVRISRANPNIVWGGARMDVSGKIHVSTDRGVTFQPTPLYSVTTMGGISGIATHPIESSTAYVLFSFAQKPKVLRTTNLGQTWEDISGFGPNPISSNGFPDVAVYDLIVFPHTPDTIWVGTEIGLFESTNNGTNWHYANNGFPAASIWMMTNVEDEVVAATHGRGIWSVSIPGMSAGLTFTPLVKNLSQGPDGMLAINIGLRSLYDSTVVTVNNVRHALIGPNPARGDTVVRWPVTQAGAVPVYATSYKGGSTFQSVTATANVLIIAPPQAAYTNTFNGGSTDFTGNGFQITMPAGFTDNAIHSTHPYTSNQNYTYMLTIPIVVASSNAFIAYNDIGIVEPGEPGSVFGDENFYDYVVVEGSTNGLTWIPVADGYNSRYDSVWLATANANGTGNPTMYRHHEVNLLNRFSAGQTILVRLRLYSDAGTNRWGWTVDNLEIQGRITGVGEREAIPTAFALSQNYPNPFNPSTTIRYDIPTASRIAIKIFDVIGRQVRTLVDLSQDAGYHSIVWDGMNGAGVPVASGMYICRIEATAASGRSEFVQQRRMLLLK
jgi:photosystem II stability/assembly factor-like uncharacterized protein